MQNLGSQASSCHRPAIPKALKFTHLAEGGRASREGLPGNLHKTFKKLVYETEHSEECATQCLNTHRYDIMFQSRR